MLLPLLLVAVLLAVQAEHGHAGPVKGDKGGVKEDQLTKADPETLEEVTSSNALSEGDVLLRADRNAVGQAWPTLTIPYIINSNLVGQTRRILAAIAMVSRHTCLHFRMRTTEPDYLHFKTSKGCASYVGFIGGEQSLFIGPTCKVGNIVHEIIHALGFHHEHTRMDREKYITVLPNNIMSGMERNFRKRAGDTFDVPYDIESIMHYGWWFFSSNGLPTIVSLHDVKSMGQRNNMTALDIKRVRLRYHCDFWELQHKETKHGGVHHTTVSLGIEAGNQTLVTQPASLQHLNATTRGHNDTSSQPASTM